MNLKGLSKGILWVLYASPMLLLINSSLHGYVMDIGMFIQKRSLVYYSMETSHMLIQINVNDLLCFHTRVGTF